MLYNAGSLVGGLINDKLGFFYGQIINVFPTIIGLVIFGFIESNDLLIWAGWPLGWSFSLNIVRYNLYRSYQSF